MTFHERSKFKREVARKFADAVRPGRPAKGRKEAVPKGPARDLLTLQKSEK
jgi:hypothetical protein